MLLLASLLPAGSSRSRKSDEYVAQAVLAAVQTGLRSDIMDTMPPSRSVRSTGRSQKLVGYLQVGQSHCVDAIFCPKTSMNITHEWGSYAPRGERAARTRTLIYLAPVTIAILAHREERDLTISSMSAGAHPRMGGCSTSQPPLTLTLAPALW